MWGKFMSTAGPTQGSRAGSAQAWEAALEKEELAQIRDPRDLCQKELKAGAPIGLEPGVVDKACAIIYPEHYSQKGAP